jgi:hypothetical protein
MPDVPLMPPNPTQLEMLEWQNQVQEARVKAEIAASLNSEAGPVDVLSLLLSSFFVLCAAEWMAEVEHDLVEADRFDTTDAYNYIDGVRCVCLSLCLSLCLSVCLSHFVSVCLSVCLSESWRRRQSSTASASYCPSWRRSSSP